MRLLTKL